jgi:nucleoside-diphosphate-sugar epimerase
MNGGVLVTGGSGFLGRAVLQRLLDTDKHPLVAAVRSAKLNFPVDVRVEVAGELGPDTDWMNCVKGVDVVIHCAARAHVMKDKLADPLAEYRKVNVQGTLALGKRAAQAGVQRFVFISSIKVNGDRTVPRHAFRADDVPAPHDAYGLSKLEAEQGLMSLARETGMEVVIIRPPLVYGPGVKGNFAAMVNWMRKGIPVPLGAVYNQRSLIALDNLVDFIALCADRERSPPAANEVFLVCDGEEISTTELLRRVGMAYGVKTRLMPMPLQWIRTTANLMGKGDVADRLLGSLVIDASKARNFLGWMPITSMDEQLKKMAQYDALA